MDSYDHTRYDPVNHASRCFDMKTLSSDKRLSTAVKRNKRSYYSEKTQFRRYLGYALVPTGSDLRHT